MPHAPGIGGFVGQMRNPIAPLIVTQATTSFPITDVTSQPVNLPASRVVGNLMLAFVGTQGSKNIGAAAGWTSRFNVTNGTANSSRRLQIFTKTIDGSEGATAPFTCSPAGLGCWSVFQISGWAAMFFSAGVIGTNANPNPDLLTPSAGLAPYLWFAAFCSRSGGTSAAPAGYSNLLRVGNTSSTDVNQSSAQKTATAASEDPGTFTQSTSDVWAAATVAIQGM